MKKNLYNLLTQLSAKAHCREEEIAATLAETIKSARSDYLEIKKTAAVYIKKMRETSDNIGIEAFFQQYGLDTDEGIAIMSLAEALLRIPDKASANDLIHDKLSDADWSKSSGNSGSSLLKASAFGMKIISKFSDKNNIAAKATTPIIRASIKQSMRLLGNHFVMGQTIKDALSRAQKYEENDYMMSYDMLGEAARSEKQAKKYLNKYTEAIETIRPTVNLTNDLYKRPAVSVKLSALYPHYELVNKDDVFNILVPRLKQLVSKAMEAGTPITIDAEESRRLDLYLDIFTEVIYDEEFRDFNGVGIAVQAYHKNALNVIEYLTELAKATGKRIPIRLVKGAYWDAEIKNAQVQGLESYPVFTNKDHTDMSYIACAYKMLENSEYIYPQFATHNAITIAEIEQAAKGKQIEFQLLHGMGKSLYDQLVGKYPCRIYAPVGEHTELLPYLIRRLLENAANSSFIKKVANKNIKTEALLRDFVEFDENAHELALPIDLYGDRKNSTGIDFGNRCQLENLQKKLEQFNNHKWYAAPIIGNKKINSVGRHTYKPHDSREKTGNVVETKLSEVKEAIDIAYKAHTLWEKTPVKERGEILEKMAILLEKNKYEAIALCINEAGKTIKDSAAEVREAIDFCRYYALQAKTLMNEPKKLIGPTGETNQLSLHGRGVFVCISPWNFPLAIFLGQVTAALVTGNSVIAKPAEQTPLIAHFAVKLLLEAGVPHGVINLLPGDGATIGNPLLSDNRIAGVVFTGSTQTAQIINNILAKREGAIIPFIAETGGQNAMIVDSSALIEQTVDDIITSAFGSAGQRCSALRVLFVQDEIADDLLKLLKGAMETLKIGDPDDIATDIGPVIDDEAKKSLQKHIKQMNLSHKVIARKEENRYENQQGYFVYPHAFEINSMDELQGEVFGPILHVIRYKYKNLDKVIEQINNCGFGLTLGIQSRIESRAQYIREHVHVGNVYVNRSMIGATVGVQPFGGEALSGTGPKAGGPNYLIRFVTERVFTVNTTAIGGNRELLV